MRRSRSPSTINNDGQSKKMKPMTSYVLHGRQMFEESLVREPVQSDSAASVSHLSQHPSATAADSGANSTNTSRSAKVVHLIGFGSDEEDDEDRM